MPDEDKTYVALLFWILELDNVTRKRSIDTMKSRLLVLMSRVPETSQPRIKKFAHVPEDQTRPECGDSSWCWSGGRFLHVLGQAVTAMSYQGAVLGLLALKLLSFLYIERNR